MSEKRGKVKAVKAWAPVSDSNRIIETRIDTSLAMAEFKAGFCRVIPVLITPITPKQRRKSK